MQVLKARVTTKGQVTLPKPLRDSLGIREGDHVSFCVESPGQASLVKLSAPGSSAGVLRHLSEGKALSVEEMATGIGRHLRKKYSRK